MRKKIGLYLLTLICLMSLSACGTKEPARIQSEESAAKIRGITESAVLTFSSIDFEDPEYIKYIDLLDNAMDYESEAFGNSNRDKTGFYLDAKTLSKAYHSYQDSIADIGDPVFVKGEDGNILIDVKADEKEAIATVYIDGSIHDGTIELIVDDNFVINSITTNVKLTLSESMKKAGMNTMIGMGTVFVMLIVISFVISAMGIIPKLQNSKNKKSEDTEKSVEKTIASIVEREESSVPESDDTELAAVISAAVAAFEGSVNTDVFVVRSIRRIR